ncbi:globoside alpha-1,3-N-acetylgalactosaminyltransferase 1-like isoform X2 [Takifugu rubripes]|uniref:globoside alpha-1,3-N-acetylgalactosaminyltransferase 1-like isoform X2 n=1 Tax=Takifugu rubripes TaxID=31033 RepID=UPI0005D2231F|nr:globoside alpha-1,3-N-acetylgalactosaminyltransferase 1-like isoform X2 [Takifugu rubripes]|eukprot:XP_011612498.1 PREDICTED: globoside alpha-1,3-N-acetylgalactosaminyltransferase 1-like isoform X2 [Takifugu rubripes]
MALLAFCKTPAGPVRVTRLQVVLYCFLFFLIIYFLRGRNIAVSIKSPRLIVHDLGKSKERLKTHVSTKTTAPPMPLETSWGAPLVWGDSSKSARRRAKLAEREIRTGLVALVVGTYAKFVRRFLLSAETYFLPDQMVTYYILTDNPRTLDPPVKLGPGRKLTVIYITELPGWSRLTYRRMSLLVDTIRSPISKEVQYVFCADVDQEFVAPVGAEILGDLVATLHPELYGMPRNTFPYQDQANGVMARGLEESYLNRYLINHRPTRVLSPEYSWWVSDMAADVPVQRLVSLGRQCGALDQDKRDKIRC